MRMLLVIGTTLASTTVVAQQRQAVPNLKPLLLAAIAQGQASGILGGDTARLMRDKFGATAPIEVDVRRVRPHAIPGCHRLSVKTVQAGVREGSSPPKDMVMAYEVNFCQNGQFPEDQFGR